MTITPLDKEILQEIVRVVRAKRVVPSTVDVGGKRYRLTYLEDHQQRMTEALASEDWDKLGILFGQLASKVKYQVDVAAQLERGAAQRMRPVKKATGAAKPEKKRLKVVSPLSSTAAARKPSRARPASQKKVQKSATKTRVKGTAARATKRKK